MIFGTAGVVLFYYLMREVYGRRGIAAGAAALTAIHPDASLACQPQFALRPDSYSRHSGTVVPGSWSATQTDHRSPPRRCSADSPIYIALKESGFPRFSPVSSSEGRWYGGDGRQRWGLSAAAVLTVVFLLIAAPYLFWMRSYTGHWTVGRELGSATMEATGSTTDQIERWREMGFRPATSWLTAVRLDPAAYLKKVARDSLGSCYALVQALGPLLAWD